MEYLPEKKRTQKIQVQKKDAKIREFREYLANNDVVLAVVKYLLALRQSSPWPEDPVEHLRDYFGRHRDPMWDVVEQLQQENIDIEEALPQYHDQIKQLEDELENEKKKNRIIATYQALDTEKTNAMGYKLMVQKLSGFAKFDLDTKISSYQFYKFIEGLTQVEREMEKAVIDDLGEQQILIEKVKYFDDSKYNQIVGVFERAFRDNQTPFLGDLENETYKLILAKLREFQPPQQ